MSDDSGNITLLVGGNNGGNKLDELLRKMGKSDSTRNEDGEGNALPAAFGVAVHPSVLEAKTKMHEKEIKTKQKEEIGMKRVREAPRKEKKKPQVSIRQLDFPTQRNDDAPSHAAMSRLFGDDRERKDGLLEKKNITIPSITDEVKYQNSRRDDVETNIDASKIAPASSITATELGPQSLQELKECLHPRLFQSIEGKLKIEKLTRVQQLSWHPILSSRDVLVRSETGSGKTLSYALPLAHKLLHESSTKKILRTDGTLVIVLVPTRELANQVSEVVQVLVNFVPFIVVSAIHGGDNRHKEKARLRKGITILVATPGRLLDHLKSTASYACQNLQTLVLDEADRLLDMGFENAIREILSFIHPPKSVLVSATVTNSVNRLAHFTLKNPIHVGETEDTFTVPESLKQHYVICPLKQKLVTLLAFLRSQLEAGSRKIVVFVSTSDSAEFHYLLLSRFADPYVTMNKRCRESLSGRNVTGSISIKKLMERANAHITQGGECGDADEQPETLPGVETSRRATFNDQLEDAETFLKTNVYKLHGNMSQLDRSAVFYSFKGSDSGVLFCTDVAARGLDMPKVDWIIHYDAPQDEKSYIHRVGRTARIGHAGDSLLFLQEHEAKFIEYLNKFVSFPAECMKPETFLFYLTKLDRNADQFWVQAQANLFCSIRDFVHKDVEVAKIALFAYQSYVRAYNTYPRHLRDIFDPTQLHLGHLATSLAITATPSEIRRRLNADKITKSERDLGRDTKRFDKGSRMEIDTKEQYHSTLVSKHIKQSKDYHTEQREVRRLIPKPFQFSEFDA